MWPCKLPHVEVILSLTLKFTCSGSMECCKLLLNREYGHTKLGEQVMETLCHGQWELHTMVGAGESGVMVKNKFYLIFWFSYIQWYWGRIIGEGLVEFCYYS